jgi:hypothetical protein
MNVFIKHGIRFVFIVAMQVLVLNQIELGLGVQLMVYPLFILLLLLSLVFFRYLY